MVEDDSVIQAQNVCESYTQRYFHVGNVEDERGLVWCLLFLVCVESKYTDLLVWSVRCLVFVSGYEMMCK